MTSTFQKMADTHGKVMFKLFEPTYVTTAWVEVSLSLESHGKAKAVTIVTYIDTDEVVLRKETIHARMHENQAEIGTNCNDETLFKQQETY